MHWAEDIYRLQTIILGLCSEKKSASGPAHSYTTQSYCQIGKLLKEIQISIKTPKESKLKQYSTSAPCLLLFLNFNYTSGSWYI